MTAPISSQIGRIAFLGFGEAGRAFLDGWRSVSGFSADVVAYDVKTDSPAAGVREAKRADYATAKVSGAASALEAVKGAHLIFSLVTADQAHEAALAALPALGAGAFFLDCNSCAPQTKMRSAERVEAAGGRYVDVAVMSPVYPRRHRSPLLISGPRAPDVAPWLAALDMVAKIHEGPVGSSSAIKMVRSVMMKGLEALVCECVLAGEKAGVTDIVLNSLDDTYPGFDWKKKAAYMLERVMNHGVRRASEMREVALTVDLLGLDGAMSRASAQWQDRVGQLQLKVAEGDGADHHQLARRILDRFGSEGGT